jgi:hypothetical protein
MKASRVFRCLWTWYNYIRELDETEGDENTKDRTHILFMCEEMWAVCETVGVPNSELSESR